MKFILILFFCIISVSLLADVVNTTDGDSYDGDIVSVTISTQDEGEITFSRDEISSIEMGNLQREEELLEAPPEEVKEEEPLQEEPAAGPFEEEKEDKEQPLEQPSQEEKPLTIVPQIKGLDEKEYKTY